MPVADTLLELQEIELRLAREKKELANLPEIKALAQKRKTHAKLKAELTKIYAARKDLDIEIEELKGQKQDAEDDVTIAQNRPLDSSDFRAVQDLQNELADLAKKLDKIEFTLKDLEPKQAEAKTHEERANAAVAEFEKGMLADAQEARKRAESVQSAIELDQRKYDHHLASLSADMQARYKKALADNRGIAVEKLEGNIPSVCHMTLQKSSMDELRHAGEIAECPYCHRMLVMPTEAEML